MRKNFLFKLKQSKRVEKKNVSETNPGFYNIQCIYILCTILVVLFKEIPEVYLYGKTKSFDGQTM